MNAYQEKVLRDLTAEVYTIDVVKPCNLRLKFDLRSRLFEQNLRLMYRREEPVPIFTYQNAYSSRNYVTFSRNEK